MNELSLCGGDDLGNATQSPELVGIEDSVAIPLENGTSVVRILSSSVPSIRPKDFVLGHF
jgi:hypothetical protein